MSGPTKKNKPTLGDRAERREQLALLAGIIVVVGLLIESGPELAHSIIFWELPSRAILGSLVVTLGVAGEVLFSWRALQAARQAELDAEERIAASIERSKKAEQAAAEANLARVKIEDKFKWRILPREAIDALIEALLSYEGFRIDIFTFGKNVEVIALADTLNRAFLRAGCNSKVFAMVSDRLKIADLKGVTLALAMDATPQENGVAPFVLTAVANVLSRSSIGFSQAFGAYRKTDRIEQDTSPSAGVNPSDIAPFRIQIVEKNLLEHSWSVRPPQE